ncbi:MAG: FG-GAP-like repeat-containing protein, partial [Verrucomicrobiota bacterium]
MKNIHEFSPGTCLSTNLLRSSLAVGLLLLLAASPPATAQPTPGGSPDPPCTPPASGIVSWWPAEGNANDIIGANNGVLEGAVSFGPGEVGEAFLFNNTNADVRIPASASLNVGAGSGFTVEAWVNSLDVSQFQPLFEWNDRIAFGVQFYISQDSGPGSLYANVTDSGGGWHQFHTSSAPLTNNVFQHVALTYDQASGTGTIYCNGLIVAQQNLGSFTPLTSLDLYMGRPPATAGVTFSLIGLLDEPSLYDRALSSNEIAAIYQAGSGGKCPPTPMAPNVPVITSFTPPAGQTGAVVNITGLNFSPVASNNIVRFGAVQAVVSAASATNLIVTVPVGATFAPITETVNGLTAYADAPFLPTFPGGGPITSASLGPQITLPTGSWPASVTIADLDGDGKPDLVIPDSWGGDISIYQNIGTNGTLSAASFGPRIVLPGILSPFGDGANPTVLAVADIDGDGRPDIIAVYAYSDLVAIYRNLSSPGLLTSNSFAAPVYLPGGNGMYGLAVQDLNDDGKPDIVTGNSQDNTISLFQNQSMVGNIAFAPRVNLAVGTQPQGVAIGDVDGDGMPDLAVANSGDGTISIYRNLGLGGTITTNSFAPQVVFPAPTSCAGLALGDVDGDGKLDLVVSGSSLSSTIAVLRNTATPGSISTNSFAPAVDFPLGGWGTYCALGDINGDGKPDIAVVSQLNSLLSVFQNESTPGSFTNTSLGSRLDFAAGWNPLYVAIGDLNGDGRPDIVFVNLYDSTVSIYQNLTPFGVPPAITQQPTNQTVTVGNTATFAVTATGSLPLNYQWNFNSTNLLGATNATLTLTNVQSNQSGNYTVLVTNLYGSILSSNALLTVTSPTNVPVIISFTPPLGQTGTVLTIKGLNFSPIAGSNIVYFGAMRAVVSTASATNLTVTVPVGATFAPITETVNGLTAYADAPFLPTFPGGGSISSSSLATQFTLPTGNGPGSVLIADLDGDGKPDLIIADSESGDISIYQNVSTNATLSAASFRPRIVLPGLVGSYHNPYAMAVADIDGDGRPDIVAAYGDSGQVAIYRNLSSPGPLSTNSFAAPVYLQGGNFLLGLAVQDLNGDGKPDVVIGNFSDNTISIFQNQSTAGNIAFAPRVNLAVGTHPEGVAIGDVDGDGLPDLAVANSGDATISIFRNLGLGGTLTTNSFAPPVVFATPATCQEPAFGNVDGDGKLDLVVACSSGSSMLAVLRNTATPGSITTNSFARAVDFPLLSWGQGVALGDINGDGKPDIAVVSGINTVQNSALSLFQNQSTPGSFTSSSLGSRVDFVTGNDPGGVAIGDLNGDGRPDVVCVNYYDATISIYQNLTPFGVPPAITQQPTNQTVPVGNTATFAVTATGSLPLSYQWNLNSTNLAGATNSTLTLTNVQFSQSGNYSVLVTNLYGSILSS